MSNLPLFRFPVLFLALLSLMACVQEKPMKIAVSKASPYYVNWLLGGDSTLEIIDMYEMEGDSAAYIMTGCSGLLLTGGEDIYPGWYGQENDTLLCTEFDRRRDSLEMRLLHRAIALQLPILGICRGSQFLNVYLKGTLHPHLPAVTDSSVLHRCDDYLHCEHQVFIKQGTLLHLITGLDTGTVNSNHHQAANFVSPLLKTGARSEDEVIESLEWMNPEGKEFLLGVQWHPERMDTANPLSGNILRFFLDACRSYRNPDPIR